MSEIKTVEETVEERVEVFAKMVREIDGTLADLRQGFVEKVRERIQAASSEEISQALARPALPHD